MKHVARKPKITVMRVRPTKNGEDMSFSPAPCFYFDSCKQISSVCKNGKSLCRRCADRVTGPEYQLRVPVRPELRGLDNYLLMRGVMELSPLRRPRHFSTPVL